VSSDRSAQGTTARTRARLDKAPDDVAAMFDGVAPRYDRTNSLLSLGSDRRWRRQVREAVGLRAGQRVLDLAAGTGTSTVPFLGDGREAVGCDFSLGMLAEGKRGRPGLPLVAGDATRLPFADASFDAVTISFGLRNVADPDAALREMLRVSKPSGRLVVCEFSHPTWPPFRRLYDGYLVGILPAVARRTSSNPEAYDYLGESIRAWPDQHELALRIGAAGWAGVEWKDLTLGIVALHRATRPGHTLL
jgi:demethylmenaquinone methyltransferase/2-methoxy-6-polyprenyl-1,4-benzoquinol methylase